MSKLIEKFRTNPTDANRARLQSYLRQHMMAILLASAEELAFLKASGFAV